MEIELPAAAKLTVSILFTKRPLPDKLGEVASDSQDTQANGNPTAGSSKAECKCFSFY